MAIQVNGTEVISNSRALKNIASVDATTVAAMSAAGVGATAAPVSGGWLGWTTKTLLYTWPTGQNNTYTVPSDGWYRIESLYGGNGSGSGSLAFNVSTAVSWIRSGSGDKAYTTIDIGTSLGVSWFYDSGNKYHWIAYLEANSTVQHNAFYSAAYIYQLT